MSISKTRVFFFVVVPCAFAFYALTHEVIFLPNDPSPQQIELESRDLFTTGAELYANSIFRTTGKVAKVSAQVAAPLLLKVPVGIFVEKLPLEKDVKDRIQGRLTSSEFVDEIVPFLWALKEQYGPGFGRPDSFENYVKSYFSPTSPGSVHSLFEFNHTQGPPSTAATTESPKTKPAKASMFSESNMKMIAQIVTMYDAIFLRTGKSPLTQKVNPDPKVVESLKPLLKKLFEDVAQGLPKDSPPAQGIRGALANPEKMDTIATTLVKAISIEAYKAYQLFATRANRIAQLRTWMRAELRKPKGGSLWTSLQYANEGRRYGIQVVVDGLQGHLMEALAANEWQSSFTKQFMKDQAGPAVKPAGVKVLELPDQRREFLKTFGQQGFTHPQYLAYFRFLYEKYRGSIASFGISSTPTISVRNLPVAWSGAPVAGEGSTGIPNFHFVDRKSNGGNGRAYYFYGNDAILLEELAEQSGMKTMFSRLDSVVSLNCNAQYDQGSKVSYNPFLNLALGEKIRNFGDNICLDELNRRLVNERKLRALRLSLLEFQSNFVEGGLVNWAGSMVYQSRAEQIIDEIAELEDEGLPQYVLYYNPWPDHFAHGKGPFSDEILSVSGELNNLDHWLQKISKIYQDAGVYNRTIFGMAGDHGLTPVKYALNPEVEVFNQLQKEGIPLIIEKISSDEGEGPKMNHPIHPRSMKGKDVIIASTAGGNFMIDLFKNQGDGFDLQPLRGELTQWKTLQGQTVPIVDVLTSRLKETLDYLVVREGRCSPEGGQIYLAGYRQGQKVEAQISRQAGRIFYRSEGDLLGVREKTIYAVENYDADQHQKLIAQCVDAARSDQVATWCTESQWTLLTTFTNRVDSVRQLSHLYDTDRAGTINLFPKPGYGYNTKVPGRHAGEHFHEKDAFVGFWGAPIRSKEQLRFADNGSLAPTIYEWLTGKPVTVGREGWGFPSLLGKIQQ